MKKMAYRTLAILAAALVLGVCGDPIPLKEMTKAKSAITKAENVKAEKYAEAEFKAAGDLLKESHTLCKDEKYEDAAKKAVDAENKAKEAYDKAAPLLAKDAIDTADQSIKLADDAYASELAADEYKDAVTKQKNANDLFEAKNFEGAAAAAVDADQAAKNARNSAISKKGMLADAISEVKVTLREGKKFDADTIAPDKYSAAESNLADAEKSLEDLTLKNGFTSVNTAKINADEAYQAALKETAIRKIADAEKALSDAEASKNAAKSKDDLKHSKELIETAQTQFNDALYLDAIDSANESIRVANQVSNRTDATAVAATDTTVTTDSASAEDTDFIIYKVKWREAANKDCLWMISQKFYGNPRMWKKIHEANRDIIRNPHWIFPGQKLKIPKIKNMKK